jgi:dinuclear metal center YbgI/SA1388 family protein
MNDEIRIKDIANYLETIAPLSYQESYDNSGLIVGDTQTIVTGILLSLDSTEAIIDEAITKGCNLVISHHPIVFKGLKKLNGGNYIERTIIKAIKNDIAIYAIHTNLDNVTGGVNFMIAEKLQLQNVQILAPKTGILTKLTTFVPIADTQKLLESLYEAGSGQIGNYDHCSFSVDGTGTFRPNKQAQPVIGQSDVDEAVNENRIEVIFPTYLESKIVQTLQQAHPYEEVAYYLTTLNNQNQEIGSGAVGNLNEALSTNGFLNYLKTKMNLSVIRHTSFITDSVKRIAVCGGSGSFLLSDAIKVQADVFITADYKYHEFFDADNRIIICDIGHYESEVFTKELLFRFLSKKFTNFAVKLAETNTNPVSYYH